MNRYKSMKIIAKTVLCALTEKAESTLTEWKIIKMRSCAGVQMYH